jgi:hypothetical protein
MEQTQKVTQNTDNGAQNGTPDEHLRLPDLPEYKLGLEGDLNGFDATDIEFSQFAQGLVPIKGDSDKWTWEERRDFLNWCLDEQVLTIIDDRLVPVEETVPTAPLSHESEETGFLHDVERAIPVMQANPEINAKGLADALGLKSVVYAQMVKVYVNAHKSAEEGV